MRANKNRPEPQFDRPDPAIRFYCLYGPDEAGSRALAARLLKGLDAEKAPLDSAALKGDPALLADEAGAISMFGGRKLLWIEPAGDEIADAVAALLESPPGEHVAVAIAANLRKNGKLLKLVETHPEALVHASYALEGRNLDQVIAAIAGDKGLRPEPGVVERLAAASGGNRAIAEQECEKYAIFLEASPDEPQPLSHDVIDRLGAAWSEDRFFAIGDAALAGEVDELRLLLRQVSPGGSEAISVIRALQRRILQLLPMQARIASGDTLSAVMASQGKALFWKDKPLIQRCLARWPAPLLDRLAQRIATLEQQLIFSKAPAKALLGEEMLAIARAGRSR
ncbi:DNA polymerase III subunit delta [Sphingomicrobium lutaoense]|uniref:DNA-directed DNA polymerase n=1 Tax=Sphingomicrobium lutaoense TaxID=515949 RepID=A0A839Z3X2_9SPHN|nr:DNA polymerase III subunit delta [Sphingomicrobium lutaoense]MBB3764787.1 DNA polymerase-3 subunit delta [Sphingomicrobium lutaoense]